MMVKLSARKAVEHMDNLNEIRDELLRLVEVVDALMADIAPPRKPTLVGPKGE